jgi:hypothetical protein
MLKIFESD